MNLLQEYLHELNEIRSSGNAVKETSYYPAVSTLLNGIGKTLKPRVRCIINIKNRGVGIPDGGLFTPDQFHRNAGGEVPEGTMPARGVIEIKPTSDDAWVGADGPQVTGANTVRCLLRTTGTSCLSARTLRVNLPSRGSGHLRSDEVRGGLQIVTAKTRPLDGPIGSLYKPEILLTAPDLPSDPDDAVRNPLRP